MWTLAILKKLKTLYLSGFPFSESDAEAMIREWSQKLSGLGAEEIRQGLAALPNDRAPNPMQFRSLCRPPSTSAHQDYKPHRSESTLTREAKQSYFDQMKADLRKMSDPARVTRSHRNRAMGRWADAMEVEFQDKLKVAGLQRKYG